MISNVMTPCVSLESKMTTFASTTKLANLFHVQATQPHHISLVIYTASAGGETRTKIILGYISSIKILMGLAFSFLTSFRNSLKLTC